MGRPFVIAEVHLPRLNFREGQDIMSRWRVVHDRPTNTLTFEPRQADFRIFDRS